MDTQKSRPGPPPPRLWRIYKCSDYAACDLRVVMQSSFRIITPSPLRFIALSHLHTFTLSTFLPFAPSPFHLFTFYLLHFTFYITLPFTSSSFHVVKQSCSQVFVHSIHPSIPHSSLPSRLISKFFFLSIALELVVSCQMAV